MPLTNITLESRAVLSLVSIVVEVRGHILQCSGKTLHIVSNCRLIFNYLIFFDSYVFKYFRFITYYICIFCLYFLLHLGFNIFEKCYFMCLHFCFGYVCILCVYLVLIELELSMVMSHHVGAGN